MPDTDPRIEAKQEVVEATDDHTAVEGYVGTHVTYEHASNKTEKPRYSSDEEQKLYEAFSETRAEVATPFRESTLEDLKKRELELAESTKEPESEPEPLKPGENKGPNQNRPSLPTESK